MRTNLKANDKLITVEEEILALASPSYPDQLQPVQVKDSVISAGHLTKKSGGETAVQDVSINVPRTFIFGLSTEEVGKNYYGPFIDGRLNTY
jgi:hypothetical protein